jgi:hypothetical protein
LDTKFFQVEKEVLWLFNQPHRAIVLLEYKERILNRHKSSLVRGLNTARLRREFHKILRDWGHLESRGVLKRSYKNCALERIFRAALMLNRWARGFA